MSSPLEQAEKVLEDLIAERFRILIKIENELKLGKELDKKVSALTGSFVEGERNQLFGESFFVSWFDEEATEDELRQYFRKYGELAGIVMKKTKVDLESKSYALVVYKELEKKESFLQRFHKMNGKRIFLASNEDDGEKTILISGKMVKYVSSKGRKKDQTT